MGGWKVGGGEAMRVSMLPRIVMAGVRSTRHVRLLGHRKHTQHRYKWHIPLVYLHKPSLPRISTQQVR